MSKVKCCRPRRHSQAKGSSLLIFIIKTPGPITWDMERCIYLWNGESLKEA